MRNLLPFKVQIFTISLIFVAALAGAQTTFSYPTPSVFIKNQTISPLSPLIIPTPVPDGTPIPHGSGFNLPWGEAIDAAGNIYVADYGHGLVKKIATDGTITTLGSGFASPISVAVDASGNVYVADYYNNAVKKIAPDGVTVTTLGHGFNTPSGVAVDAAGNVFVADNGNGAVKKIAPDGATVTNLAPRIGFNVPWAVAVDATGNVYVADFAGDAVYKIAPDGVTVTTLGPGFNLPTGVAVDTAGNVYVAVFGDGTLYKIAPDGVTATAMYLGEESTDPLSVAVDAAGNVYEGDGSDGVINQLIFGRYVNKYTIKPCLPAGLALDSVTGIISGTPAISGVKTSYTVTAMREDGNLTATLQMSINVSDTINVSLCPSGLPYQWNGTGYNALGNYTIDLTTPTGVDSAVTLVLSVIQTSSSTPVTICSTDLPYNWNGTNYPAAGSYTIHLNNAAGCDSAATLVLTVIQSTTSSTQAVFCPSASPYNWNGTDYTTAGSYTVHLTSAAGCDSVATLILVDQSDSSFTHAIVCSSDLPFTWNGTDYSAAGNYTVHFTNAAGCDSAANLVLTVLQSTSSTTSVSLYSYQTPYNWNGMVLTTSGTYTFATINVVGCDSMATLILTITNVKAPPATLSYHTPNVFVKNKAITPIAPVLSPQPVPVGTMITLGTGFNLPTGVAVDTGGQCICCRWRQPRNKENNTCGCYYCIWANL